MKAYLNDTTIAFDDVGQGPAIVLIHGFPLCRRMWYPQAKALVDAGFRVIAPDLRGFGESAAPSGPYSMSDFADDIVALLDHLKLEQAVIGGMSMGGYILLNLLERYPGRARAALFLTTKAGADDEAAKARRTKLAHAVAEGNANLVTEAFDGVLFAPQTREKNPALGEQVRQWMNTADPYGLEGALLAMRDRKDFTPDLPLLDVPALVIAAEQDQVVPLDQARILEKNLPRAALCTLPEAGHMANLEQPEGYNRCLIDFLKGLAPKC